MANLATWGQVLDYTTRHKKTWKLDHGPSKTVQINADHFTKWATRGCKIKDIDQGLINDYIEHLGEWLSGTTIIKCTVAVSTALNYCIDCGQIATPSKDLAWINRDARYKFQTASANERDKVWISEADCDRFYHVAKVCDEHDLADTIWLSCYTGLSWHEWSQLQVRDLLLGNPSPAILIGKRASFKTKVGSRSRVITLDPGGAAYERLYPMLCKRVAGLEEHPKLPIFDAWQNSDAHRTVWNRVRAVAGIEPKFTPNCGRHTCLTWLAINDVHPQKASQIAGHSKIETTLTYYTHLGQEHLGQALARIGTPLSPELKALLAS